MTIWFYYIDIIICAIQKGAILVDEDKCKYQSANVVYSPFGDHRDRSNGARPNQHVFSTRCPFKIARLVELPASEVSYSIRELKSVSTKAMLFHLTKPTKRVTEWRSIWANLFWFTIWISVYIIIV